MRCLRWVAALLLLALAACEPVPGPLFTPDTPRNGAGVPVDPVYGVPLPGTPPIDSM